MRITGVIPQLRTTDLRASIRFYTQTLGFELAFEYEDFYAGIRVGTQMFHLKQIDDPDPSIDFVRRGEHLHLYFTTEDVAAAADAFARRNVRFVKPLQETPWGAREFAIEDDQGHTLYFGQSQ